MSTEIKELDRSTAKYVMECLEATIKPLAEELGVSLTLGQCSFRPTNGRFQVKLSVLDSNGETITEEMADFKSHALHYGLLPEDLGKQFIFQGQSLKICGLNRKSRKYPFIGQSSDGTQYKFTLEDVFIGLAQASQSPSQDNA